MQPPTEKPGIHTFPKDCHCPFCRYAHILLGLAYTQKQTGYPVRALETYEKLAQYAPNFQPGMVSYVGTLLKSGKNEEALEVVKKFMRIIKEDPVAYYLKARIHLAQGDHFAFDSTIKEAKKFASEQKNTKLFDDCKKLIELTEGPIQQPKTKQTKPTTYTFNINSK